MRIVFFIPSLRPGGKERRLVELLSYLKLNTKVKFVLVLMDDEIHYQQIYRLKISTIILKRKYPKDPKIFFSFYKFCKEYSPSIIHSWAAMTTIYAIPTKVLLKIPIIDNQISTSDPKLISSGIFARTIVKISMHFSDKIISNSIAGIKAYGLENNKKVTVIYNGVDLKRFTLNNNRQILYKKLGIESKYIVVMVAAFSKNKQHNLLLDVIKEINKKRNDVSFVCVGSGPTLKHIENRIVSEKISNIFITGLQQKVEPIIHLSDIGILLTDSEGISNAIIEYMALGKPVITNDKKGGSSEIIIDTVTGYITSNDKNEIASKIILLLNNDNLRKKMGIQGKTVIKNEFTIEIIAKSFINLYQ